MVAASAPAVMVALAGVAVGAAFSTSSLFVAGGSCSFEAGGLPWSAMAGASAGVGLASIATAGASAGVGSPSIATAGAFAGVGLALLAMADAFAGDEWADGCSAGTATDRRRDGCGWWSAASAAPVSGGEIGSSAAPADSGAALFSGHAAGLAERLAAAALMRLVAAAAVGSATS